MNHFDYFMLITHLTQNDLLLSYNRFLLNKHLAVIQPARGRQERILLNDLLIRIFVYSVNKKDSCGMTVA